MNKETTLLLELWELVGNEFTKSQRVDAAISIIRSLGEYGIDAADMEEAGDDDSYLAAALEAMIEHDDYVDPDDEEE